MMRRLLAALLVVAATLAFGSVVMAQESDGPTHLYGVVFYDANGNGVWDPGEAGAPNVQVLVRSADGQTEFELMSAPTFNELEPTEANVCSPLTSQTPCAGTWGIVPAGEPGNWWEVSVVPPAGASVTSANPQWVEAQTEGSELIVQFGILPVGAGGPGQVAPGEVVQPILPATGGPLFEVYAAGLFLLAGTGLMLKSRRK